jgi:hypothetical protein
LKYTSSRETARPHGGLSRRDGNPPPDEQAYKEKIMKEKDPQIARLERKAHKAEETLKLAKFCKKRGLPPLETRREHSARLRREAKELPKEKRQAVLDTFRRGGLTLGEMAHACDITIHQFVGVLMINTKTVTCKTLNEETV